MLQVLNPMHDFGLPNRPGGVRLQPPAARILYPL